MSSSSSAAIDGAFRRVAALTILALMVVPVPTGAETRDAPYRHPVVGLVVDFFDPDAGRYGAGNRGIDYLVFPGQAVRSAGAGTVVFAGSVAGENYVTVQHPDGLRSSYSYLAAIEVVRGTHVGPGDLLGATTHRFQLGFRSGDVYIDPYPLLGGHMTARLIEVVPG